jgi:uridylate kinase
MNKTLKGKESFVFSVGGSLLVTADGIETKFLKAFRAFIIRQAKKGKRFYLVVGGGVTARTYIKAALAVAPISQVDRDWVGISATRLNAQLLRTAFGSLAYPEVITDPNIKIKTQKPLVIAAGYKPGWSTDYVAVLLAKRNNIKTVINLSNIDYAYDKDPRRFQDAKKLEQVSWPVFRKIVGNRWTPGLNAPFDPIASRTAAQAGMKVVVINGRNLKNLEKFLAGEKFVGTSIS